MAVTAIEIRGRSLIGAEPVSAPLVRLRAPISFWGGVDPRTGRVADPRHPDHDLPVTGKVLAVPATIGSSSSSAIMLELLRTGLAPAALLLGQVDAILALGVIVGREMDYPVIPVLHLEDTAFDSLPAGGFAHVEGDSVTVT